MACAVVGHDVQKDVPDPVPADRRGFDLEPLRPQSLFECRMLRVCPSVDDDINVFCGSNGRGCRVGDQQRWHRSPDEDDLINQRPQGKCHLLKHLKRVQDSPLQPFPEDLGSLGPLACPPSADRVDQRKILV